jgi:predicted SAM-dependent methyltransferase
MFPDNSVDLIYASHVIEHLSVADAKRAIAEWYRVLKRNGVLRLAVPDFGMMVRMYMDYVGLDIILGPLMGGQDYEQNYHKSVFDEAYLSKLMTEAGFRNVEHWDPRAVSWHGFEDASSKRYEINGKQYSVSLNLQGVKYRVAAKD